VQKKMVMICGIVAVLAGCETVDEVPTEHLGHASLHYANGLPAGTAQLLDGGTSLNLSVGLIGMEGGSHGVHLHMVGSCEGPDFTSAGAHLNPSGHQHGTANPKGAHLGDLPNVTIGSAGAGTFSARLNGARADVIAAIFDADGTAIVVHAKPDDYKTDPSGASGQRIACGVFEPA
jgi:superoxide dismutase, Cu-Zn family